MPSKYTIWHYAVPNFGGVHELDASALSLICSIVSSLWLRDAKSTLGCLMWAYFCIVLFIRLLLPEQAHCPIQTSVNNSSVMCGRHTVGLLGNYSLFFLCSKLSLSFLLCILLPLFLLVRSVFHLFFLSSSKPSFIYSRISLFLTPFFSSLLVSPFLVFSCPPSPICLFYFLTHFCHPYFIPFFLFSSFIPVSLSLFSGCCIWDLQVQ